MARLEKIARSKKRVARLEKKVKVKKRGGKVRKIGGPFENIRTGILDYLREGFPWPARPLKYTEIKYMNWYFGLPPGEFS